MADQLKRHLVLYILPFIMVDQLKRHLVFYILPFIMVDQLKRHLVFTQTTPRISARTVSTSVETHSVCGIQE